MTKLTYRDAGLDLDLYEQSLACMPPLLKRTHTPRVLDGFGGFASLFSLDYNLRLFAKNYRHPVLVTCTDGVGSKLKIAVSPPVRAHSASMQPSLIPLMRSRVRAGSSLGMAK